MSNEAKPLTGEIALALAAIARDIEPVKKEERNKDQNFIFRGIDSIYNALQPIFAAHGVVTLPVLQSHVVEQFTTKGEKTATRAKVVVDYLFLAKDGSSVNVRTPGESVDYADKATSKAMTMAHKSALIQLFCLPTGKEADPDYYSPDYDAREELAKKREADAKAAVEHAVQTGESPELPDADAKALEEKRAKAAAAVAAKEAAGQTTGQPVEERQPEPKPAPKTEPDDDPMAPEKPKTRTKATKPEEKPAGEAPASTAAPKSDEADPENYVLQAQTLVDYKDKALRDVSDGKLWELKRGWADKFEGKLDKFPKKLADAKAVNAVFEKRGLNPAKRPA